MYSVLRQQLNKEAKIRASAIISEEGDGEDEDEGDEHSSLLKKNNLKNKRKEDVSDKIVF